MSDIGAIDYTKIVNGVMHQVVREALKIVSKNKKCNLLITFSTKSDMVIIPADLKEQYPEKMSIVLNNQFSNLRVSEKDFSVDLVFSGVTRRLSIAFTSLIYFSDRDVQFSIEFKHYDNHDYKEDSDSFISKDKSSIPNGIQKKGKIIYLSQFFKHSNQDT